MSTAISPRTAEVRTPLVSFFDQLSRARERVLLLDYDGTIARFSTHRNQAYPYPSVPELLDCIMSTCRTRVSLITGRMARQVPSLLGFNPHPEIWGSYGIERLQADGSYVAAHISKDAKDALTEAEVRLDKAGLGRSLERKPGAVAAHWRGLNPAQVEEVRTIAYRVLLPLVLRSHLLLAEFDGGLEIREPLCSKGDVVRSVLSEYGADVPVAYLGDDATDEDAFGALLGRGLTVLVRPTYRFTAAQIWIRLPEGLVQFLTDWIRACGGDL